MLFMAEQKKNTKQNKTDLVSIKWFKSKNEQISSTNSVIDKNKLKNFAFIQSSANK